jgi:hypothetical protein
LDAHRASQAVRRGANAVRRVRLEVRRLASALTVPSW